MDSRHSLDEQFLWLEAIDRDRNIARRYSIAVSQDLFGTAIVAFAWGRIGTRGQSRTISFAAADDAQRFVKQLLRRRAGARKRIGVGYRLVLLGCPEVPLKLG